MKLSTVCLFSILSIVSASSLFHSSSLNDSDEEFANRQSQIHRQSYTESDWDSSSGSSKYYKSSTSEESTDDTDLETKYSKSPVRARRNVRKTKQGRKGRNRKTNPEVAPVNKPASRLNAKDLSSRQKHRERSPASSIDDFAPAPISKRQARKLYRESQQKELEDLYLDSTTVEENTSEIIPESTEVTEPEPAKGGYCVIQ